MDRFLLFEGAPCPLPVPEGELDLAGLSRLSQTWSDILRVTDMERVAREGQAISCAKGCGTCCRQRIPLQSADAFHIAALVKALPVRQRAARIKRLRKVMASAAEAARHSPSGRLDPTERFALFLACPFLDRESCSIHPSRPAVCREHLVLTDPRHCSDSPMMARVGLVGITYRVWEALGKAGEELTGQVRTEIPMEEALDWAEAHPGLGRQTWPAEKAARILASHVFSMETPEGITHAPARNLHSA